MFTRHFRAWPGGCGDKKLGSNYGPTIRVQSRAIKKGYQQVLWLYGPDHQVTEVGTMNIFVFYLDEFGGENIHFPFIKTLFRYIFFSDKVLVTPSLSGLILPGVTRQSILQLCEQWKEFRVEQRTVTMGEIVKLQKSGRVSFSLIYLLSIFRIYMIYTSYLDSQHFVKIIKDKDIQPDDVFVVFVNCNVESLYAYSARNHQG